MNKTTKEAHQVSIGDIDTFRDSCPEGSILQAPIRHADPETKGFYYKDEEVVLLKKNPHVAIVHVSGIPDRAAILRTRAISWKTLYFMNRGKCDVRP